VQINEAQTLYSHAVGVCSQVGTYAGGFFVRPNTIDFDKSFKMFLKPWENPVGLILIAVIFGLFFLLLYWSLRRDKRDKLLVGDAVIDRFLRSQYPGQGRTGLSNRSWLSRRTGPMSSGVTRNSGPLLIILKSRDPPL